MRYKYEAIDAQGQAVSGILDADTEREAARQLQRRGLTTLSLSLLTAKTTAEATAKRRDLLMVLHELTTLLESGVSLIESVESLAHSSHHPFITQTFRWNHLLILLIIRLLPKLLRKSGNNCGRELLFQPLYSVVD